MQETESMSLGTLDLYSAVHCAGKQHVALRRNRKTEKLPLLATLEIQVFNLQNGIADNFPVVRIELRELFYECAPPLPRTRLGSLHGHPKADMVRLRREPVRRSQRTQFTRSKTYTAPDPFTSPL